MLFSSDTKHGKLFHLALLCYMSTLVVAEDTGLPINKYVNFGAPTTAVADGATITATPESWTATNTQDFGAFKFHKTVCHEAWASLIPEPM